MQASSVLVGGSNALAVAEESGDVERLTAWLVRQTGVRLDTLEQHYQRWWPRDREAVRATHAMLDPAVSGPDATGGRKSPSTRRTGSGRCRRPGRRSPCPREGRRAAADRPGPALVLAGGEEAHRSGRVRL